MGQQSIRAVFIRGGTSRGIFFHRDWLPASREAQDAIFLAAIGSPDPYGRQLNGLGGGISSLSKVMVVASSSREDCDVEYTFGQVAVDKPVVEYGTNCGNLTSAIGPFAVDEGMAHVEGDQAVLRLFNTNTQKRIIARFALDGGKAAVEGDFQLQGVAGTGAPIRLEFQDPGGAVTGRLLPTGNVVDRIELPGGEAVEASIVDATAAGVFVRAEALGLRGDELPDALEAMPGLLDRLEAIRAAAAVRLGLAATSKEATAKARMTPAICIVAPPMDASTLSGEALSVDTVDVTARSFSMGRPHRAIQLTIAMCLTVAARIEGTVVHQATRPPASPTDDLRVGQPSGVLPVATSVRRIEGAWHAEDVVVYRTARRLMEGNVLVPQSVLSGIEAGTAAR